MNVRKNEQLEMILQYHFHDEQLLEQALTHTSYANELLGDSLCSNERMEFLGDAVLELVISQWLYDHAAVPEGELSRLRAHLVCEASLSQIAVDLGLGRFLKLGKGAEKNGSRHNPATLEDLVESLIGAVYLDGGIASAEKLIDQWILKNVDLLQIEKTSSDAKSMLQEQIQMDGGTVHYELEETSGPSHLPTFVVSVWCNQECWGRGSGHSKKEAEQNAAAQALCRKK